MSIETEFNLACAWQRLPDTPEMRRLFYAAARFTLTRVLDDDSYEAMMALNDELHAFASATIPREAP